MALTMAFGRFPSRGLDAKIATPLATSFATRFAASCRRRAGQRPRQGELPMLLYVGHAGKLLADVLSATRLPEVPIPMVINACR